MPSTNKLVRFDDFELDLDSGELWRVRSSPASRETVHLPPQAAQLLTLLAESPGVLIERETLRSELWGDRWVNWEAGLHQSVRRVRRALGDEQQPRRFVETVARRGYRFVAQVDRVVSEAQEPTHTRHTHPRALGPALLGALAVAGVIWAFGSMAPPQTGSKPTQSEVPAEAKRLYAEAIHFADRYQALPALRRLELAAEEAPDWSAPWSAMADLWLDSGEIERVDRARRAIESSLARNAGDARAWRALARLRLWEEWDWIGARGALERAIRLEAENADGWQLLSALETVVGSEDLALAAARRALDLDPVSTARRADLGWTLYYFAHAEAAAAECRRGLEIDPQSVTAAQCLLQARLLAATQRGERSPADLVDEIQERLAMRAAQASCATPATEALPRLLRGDRSGALEAMLASAETRGGWDLPFALIDPLLAPLASDPRLAEVRAELDLPDPPPATG